MTEATLLGSLTALLLAALRLLPATMVSPFLGGPLAPPPARIGLALALGWAGHGIAGGAPFAPTDGAGLAAAAAGEVAFGLALAFASALPLEAARAGGRLADTLRGATLSELHVAPLRQRESAAGDLLAQWSVVLGAWAGGDRLLLQGFLASFADVPPGGFRAVGQLGPWALRLTAELAAAAAALAAPTAAAVFAADLALSLAERLAPGVGVTCAARPARAALGLAALAFAAAAAGGRLASLVAFAGRAPAGLAPGSP